MSSMSMGVVVGGAILVILVSNGLVAPVEGPLYKARRILETYHKVIDMITDWGKPGKVNLAVHLYMP